MTLIDLQGSTDLPIKLSARDRADLVAFLESLTDTSVVSAKRFSDPFAHP